MWGGLGGSERCRGGIGGGGGRGAVLNTPLPLCCPFRGAHSWGKRGKDGEEKSSMNNNKEDGVKEGGK